MKKAYPISKTRQYDVGAATSMDVQGQGTIPYAQQTDIATPSVAKGKPSGKMEVRGRGAMLRATTFTAR